jgi:hypothetical protein
VSTPAGNDPAPAKPFALSQTRVYKMYYTSCDECGAVSDYADTPKEAQANRRRHVEAHRRFERGEALHPIMANARR